MTFTNMEKLSEVVREISMREIVYKRKAGDKPMTLDMRRKIAIMGEIADDYRRLIETAHREAKYAAAQPGTPAQVVSGRE